MMRKIVQVHFPDIDKDLLDSAVQNLLSPPGDQRNRKKACNPGADQLDPGLKGGSRFQSQEPDQGRGSLFRILFKKSPDYFTAQNAISRFRI